MVQSEFENLHDFMSSIGGFRVDDIFDKKIKVKVYEDDNGYIMMYNQKQAKEFAEKNELLIGTVSMSDKGYEREGDSDSGAVSLYTYQTRGFGTNIKKFFFYTKQVDAHYEEVGR